MAPYACLRYDGCGYKEEFKARGVERHSVTETVHVSFSDPQLRGRRRGENVCGGES